MQARQIIGAAKTIISDGDWQTGRMPRSAFPLSKSGGRAYRLGNRRWRAIKLIVAEIECRVVISYRADLMEFQALFGVDHGGDTKIIASIEHHRSHVPPWHAHVCCGPISGIPAGIKRGPWVRCMGWVGKPQSATFPQSDHDAFNKAARFFRLAKRPDEGLVLL